MFVTAFTTYFWAKSIYHVCFEMRPKQITCVSTNMPKNIRLGRSEILVIFVSFLYADLEAKLLLGGYFLIKLL